MTQSTSTLQRASLILNGFFGVSDPNWSAKSMITGFAWAVKRPDSNPKPLNPKPKRQPPWALSTQMATLWSTGQPYLRLVGNEGMEKNMENTMGLRVYGLGLRVYCLGFRVYCLGLRVYYLVFRVWNEGMERQWKLLKCVI